MLRQQMTRMYLSLIQLQTLCQSGSVEEGVSRPLFVEGMFCLCFEGSVDWVSLLCGFLVELGLLGQERGEKVLNEDGRVESKRQLSIYQVRY